MLNVRGFGLSLVVAGTMALVAGCGGDSTPPPDVTAPTVTSIVRTDADPTNAASVDFTVTFSEAVTGVDTGDFSVTVTVSAAGVISAVAGSGAVYTVTVNTVTGDGTLRLDIGGGATIDDGAANPLVGPYTSGQVYTVDNLAPGVTSIVRVNADPTNAASVNFTVTFDETVTGVAVADFTATGTATGTVSAVTPVSGTVYTVTVNTVAGNGTLRLDIQAGATIADTATNALPVPYTSGQVYTVDNTAPGVTSIVRTNTDPTNAASVEFTVTIDGSVTGVDTTDFTLTTTGTVAGSISGISGSGAVYTVTVNTIAGDGTLRLDIADDNTIVDAATNPLGGAGVQDYTSGQVYTVDTTVPGVTSIVRTVADPTNATSVDFTVTIDESVTGVDMTDFAVTVTGTATGNVSAILGSGTVYTVTVNTVAGDGTLRLDISDNNTIVDAATNPLGGAGTQDYTSGQFYTVDNTAPVVLSTLPDNGDTGVPTNAVITIYFDGPMDPATIVAGNIVVDDLTTPIVDIAGVIAYSAVENSATFTPGADMQTTAVHQVTIAAAVADAAGNLMGGPGVSFTFTTAVGPDLIIPTVDTFSVTETATNGSATVVMTESDDLGVIRWLIVQDDATQPSVAEMNAGGTAQPAAFAVTGGEGAHILYAWVMDAAQKISTAPAPFDTVTLDTIDPGVTSIVLASPNPTKGASVNYTVTFDETVTGVDTGDFTVTGTAAGAVLAVAPVSGSIYTVTVNGVGGDGSLRLDITDDDTIVDVAQNPLGGAGAQNYTSGQAYTVDTTDPGVTSIVRASANPTNAASVNFTATFDEDVVGVGIVDFVLATGGSASGVVAAVTPVSASIYTVTVNTVAGNGSLRLDVSGTAVITDLATNLLPVPYLGGQTYTIDNSTPGVTSIVRASADPTNAASVDFTVTFDESVTGVAIADFAATVSGTAAGTVSNVAGGPAVYTVTVNTIVGDGTLRLDIPVSATIADTAANALPVPYAAGEDYLVDNTVPTVTVDSLMTSDTTPQLTGTVFDGGSGLDNASIQVTVGGNDYFPADVTILAGVWTLADNAIAPALPGATFGVAASITDNAGNVGTDVTNNELVVDTTGPGVPGDPTDAGTDSGATVTFNWAAATDAESGIASYWLQVGTSPGGNSLLDADVGNVLTYDFDAAILDGWTVYARVQAINGAGIPGAYSGNSDGILIDASQPWVTWSQPNSGWTNIGLAETILVQFSEAMDPASFAGGVHVYWGSSLEPLNGYDLTWDGGTNELTIVCDTQNPAGVSNNDILLPDTAYTITIDTTVTDLLGNPLDQSGIPGNQPYTDTFTTDEKTPPELFSMEVDNGSGPFDALTEVVPVDAVEGGDTIDFYFVDSVTLAQDVMNQTRARISIYGSGNTRIEAGINENGVQSVVELGGNVYRFQTWGPHNLGGGDFVDIVNMVPLAYNGTNLSVTVFNGMEFDVDLGATLIGAVTQDGSVLTYYDQNGDGNDVRWTAADQLTLTLGPGVSLVAGGEYSVRLNDVSDLAWNMLDEDEYVIQVMSDEISGVGPTVLSTIPADTDIHSRKGPIIISFSEAIDKNSLVEVTITGIGVTTSDFVIEYEVDEGMGMSILFMEPIQALPQSTLITVTLPGSGIGTAIADLTGNEMALDYVFSYTTDVEMDGNGPTISMTIPADGDLKAGNTWNSTIEIAFEDSFTGNREAIDETTIDMSDYRIVEDPAGAAIVKRGWEFFLQGDGTILQLRPTTWPGFEDGKTYRVYVGPNITDMAGNAMAGEEWFEFTMADFTGLGENRSPTLNDLEIELVGSTTQTARALVIGLSISDDDDDVVTVTITDVAYGGSVAIVSDRVTNPGEWDWWTNQGQLRYGSDGPPMGGDPAALDADTFYDDSGYYWFDITLSDGFNPAVTYTARAWIWATDVDATPDVVPEVVSVGGVALSPTEIVLMTDSTPTLVWQDMDAANADFASVFIFETSAIGGDEGAGYGFTVGMNPNDTSVTVPDDQPLDPSIYLCAVVEMKKEDNFGGDVGQGWSLDFGQVMLGDMSAFFVYGPTNSNLWDDEHAVGQIGITVDPGTGAYTGSDGFSGTYLFGRNLAASVIDSAVAIDGVDAGGVVVQADEVYAYGAPELVISDSSGGLPMPVKGFTGRSEGLFSVARGGTSRAAITVGSPRDITGGFDATSAQFDGTTWSCAGLQINDDGTGSFDGAWAFYGTLAITATDASSGVVTVTITNQDGTSGAPFPVPFTLDTVTGEFVIDMGGGDMARGYVGGGANRDIMVLSRNTNADLPWMLVAARQQVVTGVAQITGVYNFTQIMLQQDVSGSPYVLQSISTMTGTLTFDGAGNYTADVVMSDGQTMTDAGTYAVNATSGGIVLSSVASGLTQLMVGPDFNTCLGIAVGTDDSLVKLIIASKP